MNRPNIVYNGPIDKIMDKQAEWGALFRAARKDGREADERRCGDVAHQLGWALSVLGIAVPDFRVEEQGDGGGADCLSCNEGEGQ